MGYSVGVILYLDRVHQTQRNVLVYIDFLNGIVSSKRLVDVRAEDVST